MTNTILKENILNNMATAFENMIQGNGVTNIITKEKVAENLLQALLESLPYNEKGINPLGTYYKQLLEMKDK